jgi:hypothetical protein
VVGGRANMAIYRTHVCVMHDAMPQERFGYSWPKVECPDGSIVGPCRVTLAKYPAAQYPAAR